MKPAGEIQPVNASLVFWQEYDSAVKVDLSSHAVLAADGWLIIDPIPLREDVLNEWLHGKQIAGIVITSANHERAAAVFKKKCAVPVIAHKEAGGDFSFAPDRLLEDGEEIHGVAAIPLPGFATGEIALHAPGHGGMLLMGDALINLQPGGLEMLPRKYCNNFRVASKSLQKLLQFSFEVMTFAHGTPIISGAKHQFENILQ